jgi:hypothetical protein
LVLSGQIDETVAGNKPAQASLIESLAHRPGKSHNAAESAIEGGVYRRQDRVAILSRIVSQQTKFD